MCFATCKKHPVQSALKGPLIMEEPVFTVVGGLLLHHVIHPLSSFTGNCTLSTIKGILFYYHIRCKEKFTTDVVAGLTVYSVTVRSKLPSSNESGVGARSQ